MRKTLRSAAAWSFLFLCCLTAPLTGGDTRLRAEASPRPPSTVGQSGQGGRRVKAMVRRTPQVEALLAARRIELLEEYAENGESGRPGAAGAPLLISGVETDVAAAESASGGAGRRRVQDRVHLRSRTIDTSGALAPPPSASSGKGLLEIVQFHGPIKREWLAALRSKGRARPVAYLPDNAYVVWAEDPSRLASTGLPLQWREELSFTDRLSPELRSSAGPVDVTLQIVRAGDHDAVLDEIRSRAIEVLMEPRDFGEVTHVRVKLPPSAIEVLAARPEVLWVEPFETPVAHDERTSMVAAGLVSSSRPILPGYPEWLRSRGLDNLGSTIVDVTDTGIDSGGTDVMHPGLKGRVAYSVDMTGEGLLEDCPGHGTNVAGILAGAPVPGNLLADSEGYLLGLGVAPSVRVGSTRIFTCEGRFVTPASFADLVMNAYSGGARIGNNSWGGSGSGYNTVDAEYDALVRDVNGNPGDGDQAYLPIFSVGNAGPDLYTLSWPGTAKNVLSVGGTEGYRPTGTDGCTIQFVFADNVDHVLFISSRGPTADGRIKPDLVAPASHVQSLASTASRYTGSGVCDAYFPPGQHLINWSSGTSQAAPHVAGAAAIAAEVYARQFGAPPSPAMLKAVLINHAHDMGFTPDTPSNTSTRPNGEQGWGRVDIGAVVDARARFASDQEITFSATGDSASFEPIVAEDPSAPIVVTLVWTDAPGAPIGWSWVNDLDLIVETDGETYLGNVLEGGLSVPGGEADFRNNVENVILAPGTRSLRVRVEAANIAGDGVPSLLSETDQDFALYVSNARLVTAAGRISFLQDQASCGAAVPVRVTDLGLRGLGAVSVSVASGADRETPVLSEDPPGTGSFTGSLAAASGVASPGDGVLQISDGEAVTAFYTEPDPATGMPVIRSAGITARCAPPVISQPRVGRIGDGEATIQWRTDRPSSSAVRYGQGGNRNMVNSDPALVTKHSVRLSGLSPCTFHTATLESADAAGLRASGPAQPLRFSTGPGMNRRHVLFRDDMEALGSRWTHAALGGGLDEWELGFPGFGPPGLPAGKSVWGTNLDGYYQPGVDAVLISPPIDLGDVVGPQLTFLHYYAIAGGMTPVSFNDGGWVEISSDGGATWAALEPAGGYPDVTDVDNPYLPPGAGVYAGSLFTWSKATFDLSSFTGNVIRIRFHIWQDPGENNPTGAGWYIDDVEATSQGVCHQGRLFLDAEEYGCSSRATATLSDSHLNRNSTASETAQVTAASDSGEITVTLTEIGPNTGEFRGTLKLSSSAGTEGALGVAEGEILTLRYQDEDAGGGVPAVATASAQVSDCSPPPPPDGVWVAPDGTGRLSVSWTRVASETAPDLQGYRIYYDSDGPGPAYSGTGALQGASPVRAEASQAHVTLTSLGTCVPQFVTVSAFDRLGNESSFSSERSSMTGAPEPCTLGRVALAQITSGCRETIGVTVTDGNADPDHGSAGTVAVVAAAPSQPGGPLPILLTETGPASGVFAGSLHLSPTPQAGSLAVSQGDVVTVQYADADDGLSGARTVSASADVTDCAGPIISQIMVTDRGADRAVVRWLTDEPATSVVSYGADPSLGRAESDLTLQTVHSLALDKGIAPCSTVYFTVSSTDVRANPTTATDMGAPMRFGSFRNIINLADDFESGSPGWTHRGLSGATDEWELGPPSPVMGGPPGAYSGSALWGTDLDDVYEIGADMVLVSPPIDLTGTETATLTFKHWYDISRFGPPLNGLDDGAFLEISLDDGATWAYITPAAATPYTDIIAPNGYMPFGAMGYAGASNGWSDARFLLDPFAGKVVRVRFHLLQDAVDDQHPPPGAGWYIEDVAVDVAGACHEGVIQLDRTEYACGGEPAVVRVTDEDLDIDPAAPDTAIAVLNTESEPEPGQSFTLMETGPSTGIFEALVTLSASGAAGALRVAEGDTVLAVYDDADDGTGSGRPARASARIVDCAAPVISAVRILQVTSGSFTVVWATTEPADSRLLYGTDPSLGSSLYAGELTTSHSITLDGLPPCTRYYFTVASADAGGNLAREDQLAPVRVIQTSDPALFLREDFAAGAPGWSHTGHGDTWTIQPLAGGGIAATPASGLYARLAGEQDADFALVSLPFSLEGASNSILTVTHSFNFAFSSSGGDGGWVETWDGSRWLTIVPAGGYPASIAPEASPAGLALGGFSGTGSGTAAFDLSALAGSVTRLRFHVFIQGGVGPTGTGWRIDDVTVSGSVACREGRLAFERDAVTCADASVPVTLMDRDLDLNPSLTDSAGIEVTSTSDPNPLQLTLVEDGSASGAFRADVPISADGRPGTLRIDPGGLLTGFYLDADDGTGTPRTATVSIPELECGGPVISRVSAIPADDRVVLRWATDRPATSEVTLTPSSGPQLTARSLRLTTSHDVTVHGAQACATYRAGVASEDPRGNRTSIGAPAEGVTIETSDRRILFADDMEGPNPGWTVSGPHAEWERGAPAYGPPSAFSGQNVFGTDLQGVYDGGADGTLASPPIDLRGVATARLAFWHWFDIFGKEPPNSFDDAGWVEVQTDTALPVYIEPVGGYPDVSDSENGRPLREGTPVYAGQSGAWERAVFDLTPFVGRIIKLRFRLWNDRIDLIFNRTTGAGWYIDDVEVSEPDYCFPAPTIAPAPRISVTQGASTSGVTVSGSGFRSGASISFGSGITVPSLNLISGSRIALDLAVDPLALVGPRDLKITNPDGQSATLPRALEVLFAPSRADINGSHRVDGSDLFLLAGAFGTQAGDPGYLQPADLNSDGFVDGMDLALLAASFGASF